MSELQKESSTVGSISWDNILNKLHTRIEGRSDINQGQGESKYHSNTKHEQNLKTTNSHRTNNEYLIEKVHNKTQDNYTQCEKF